MVMARMTQPIQTYRDLIAWQKAYALALSIYACTQQMPSDERYRLTNQIRRSAISIASNIAEGYGRGQRNDYLRFLRIARGSLYEVETQLMFLKDLHFIDTETYTALSYSINETMRVLNGLIKGVEKHGHDSPA
jgi:four helix bundle protein